MHVLAKLYLALVQYLVLTDYGKANMSLPSVYAKAYLLLIDIRAIFQLDGERLFLDYKGLAACPNQETQSGFALLPIDNVIHACHNSGEPRRCS